MSLLKIPLTAEPIDVYLYLNSNGVTVVATDICQFNSIGTSGTAEISTHPTNDGEYISLTKESGAFNVELDGADKFWAKASFVPNNKLETYALQFTGVQA